MKTRIKKIGIVAAALLFVSSGVSFAHDRDKKHPGKAYGHHKVKKHQPGWNNKHVKPKRHHRERYVNNEIHHQHHYENHHRRGNNEHFKPGRHHRKKYVYKEINHHHYNKNHHRRPAPREAVIYKAALKDPNLIFKVILKGHRLF